MIVYGKPIPAAQKVSTAAASGFASWLRVDERLTTIGTVALEHADGATVHALLRRLRAAAPPARGFTEHLLRRTLFACSVEGVAQDLRTNVRTLRWRCAAWGLPPPKTLLSLARIYHVQRLARWSGAPPTVVATALGFSSRSNYRRLVRTVLAAPASEVEGRGGPSYMANLLVAAVESNGVADFDTPIGSVERIYST